MWLWTNNYKVRQIVSFVRLINPGDTDISHMTIEWSVRGICYPTKRPWCQAYPIKCSLEHVVLCGAYSPRKKHNLEFGCSSGPRSQLRVQIKMVRVFWLNESLRFIFETSLIVRFSLEILKTIRPNRSKLLSPSLVRTKHLK